jgi:hypothetical protein
MADDSLDKSKQPERSWTPFLLVALFVAFGLWYFVAPHDPPFRNPYIKASPFVWPEGCPEKQYVSDGRIPRACGTPNNIFLNARSAYGFPSSGRGPRNYYRVGNDVISIKCSVDDTTICTSRDVIKGVFFVKNGEK